MTGEARLIAVDWGTTSCRAALLSETGAVMATSDGGAGILAVTNGAFEDALTAFLSPWQQRVTRRVPIILSGMIGSRQGWSEAPYVRCPAGLSDIAAHIAWIDSTPLGRIAIVPGLDVRNGTMPDVMRGEEVQIIGAFGDGSGLALLPGTHSKWATVERGRITKFRSFMTGEVFAALKDHTILGRLMTPSEQSDDAVFLRGVTDGAESGGPGALLNRIFATRTLGLFGEVAGAGLADYLSGLLIGAEVAEAARDVAGPVTIIGNAALTVRYEAACRALGLTTQIAPVDSAARGAYAVARAARLIPGVA